MRCVIIWLVFCQVERQFDSRELNRQPLRLVGLPLHYHPVVKGHLGPFLALLPQE